MNKAIKIVLGTLVGHHAPDRRVFCGPPRRSFRPRHRGASLGSGILSRSLPTVEPDQQTATPAEVQTLFTPFWEAWNIVHDIYVDQPLDDVALMRGAIRGMMDAVGDKQTYYMDPIVYESATSELSGEYEGIGAYVDTEGEYLTIISPIEGSPAQAAGLKPGDQIVAIDGVDMTGTTPEQARQKVLGPAGIQVTLTVAREGESEPLEFTITRAKITIDSVTGKMLENNIAYIDINSFGDKTTTQLESRTG